MNNPNPSSLIDLVRQHASHLYKESGYLDAVAHYEKESHNADFFVFTDMPGVRNSFMDFTQDDLDVMTRRMMMHKLEHPVYIIRKLPNLGDNRSELAYSIHAIMEKCVFNYLKQ